MIETPNGGHGPRRRTLAATLCSMLVLGGLMVAAPAHADSPADASVTVAVPLTPATVTPAVPTTTRTTLAAIDLRRGSSAVYPVKDGYHDTVRFGINPRNLAGQAVPVEGVAVLTRGGTAVKRWALDGTKTIIDWNGRVRDAVKPGVYRLAVTAWSPDGSMRTASTRVRVEAEHLEKRTMTVRSNVGSASLTASMPKRLLNAYTMGTVKLQVRTDAEVSGRATLIFSNGSRSASLRLRDGVHTSPKMTVPQGFERVTITHRWKPGTVRLKSVKAIWSYSVLR
jgi:hypothetical protein